MKLLCLGVILSTVFTGCANLPKQPSPAGQAGASTKSPETSLVPTDTINPIISTASTPIKGTKPLLPISVEGPTTDLKPCFQSNNEPNEFAILDLQHVTLDLANTKADRIISTLKKLGITALSDAPMPEAMVSSEQLDDSETESSDDNSNESGPTGLSASNQSYDSSLTTITCDRLPVFLHSQSLNVNSLPSVIQSDSESDASKFELVNLSEADFGKSNSLLVFYHPENDSRLRKIRELLRQGLDSSPTQVYIESMVLEVNEEGMKELGMSFFRSSDNGSSVSLGLDTAVSGDSGENLLSLAFSGGADAEAVASLINVKVNALVSNGTAEVLSRPGIMTLDNRPAIIEVGEQKQYPVVSSTTGDGTVELSYDYEEVTPGIL